VQITVKDFLTSTGTTEYLSDACGMTTYFRLDVITASMGGISMSWSAESLILL